MFGIFNVLGILLLVGTGSVAQSRQGARRTVNANVEAFLPRGILATGKSNALTPTAITPVVTTIAKLDTITQSIDNLLAAVDKNIRNPTSVDISQHTRALTGLIKATAKQQINEILSGALGGLIGNKLEVSNGAVKVRNPDTATINQQRENFIRNINSRRPSRPLVLLNRSGRPAQTTRQQGSSNANVASSQQMPPAPIPLVLSRQQIAIPDASAIAASRRRVINNRVRERPIVTIDQAQRQLQQTNNSPRQLQRTVVSSAGQLPNTANNSPRRVPVTVNNSARQLPRTVNNSPAQQTVNNSPRNVPETVNNIRRQRNQINILQRIPQRRRQTLTRSRVGTNARTSPGRSGLAATRQRTPNTPRRQNNTAVQPNARSNCPSRDDCKLVVPASCRRPTFVTDNNGRPVCRGCDEDRCAFGGFEQRWGHGFG